METKLQAKGGFPLSRYFYVLVPHVNFTRVNKIDAKYKVLSLNVKVSEIQLYAYVRLSLIVSILFANVNFTHARR